MNKKLLTISVILLGIFCFLFFYEGELLINKEISEQTLISQKITNKETENLKKQTVEQNPKFDYKTEESSITGLLSAEK